MDIISLLQEKIGKKCVTIHHNVQKDGNNVSYLPKEPICTPHVFGTYTWLFTGASDFFQAEINGQGLWVGAMPRENRPKENVIKCTKEKAITCRF